MEQKPESSQNSTGSKTPDTVEKTEAPTQTTQTGSAPSGSQPQLSEEDKKALENIAAAIGIPQIVQEVKRLGEQQNLMMARLGGTTAAPEVTGISGYVTPGGGFMEILKAQAPMIIGKVVEAIDHVISGSGQASQINPIKQEIMDRAVEQATKTYAATEKAVGQLATLIGQGGEVLTSPEGDILIKRSKEIKKE